MCGAAINWQQLVADIPKPFLFGGKTTEDGFEYSIAMSIFDIKFHDDGLCTYLCCSDRCNCDSCQEATVSVEDAVKVFKQQFLKLGDENG